MIQPPNLVLPSLAMPWGRWVQEIEVENSRLIQNIKDDFESAGTQFSTKADSIARNVAGIQVATISYAAVPGFSASITADFSAPWQNKLTPIYSFSSPSSVATSCLAIATWRVTATTGEAPNWPIMQVNGKQFTDMAHNNQRPVQDYTQGYYSLQGNVPLSAGESVNIQFGVRGSPYTNASFTFDQCQMWLAFYGRIS